MKKLLFLYFISFATISLFAGSIGIIIEEVEYKGSKNVSTTLDFHDTNYMSKIGEKTSKRNKIKYDKRNRMYDVGLHRFLWCLFSIGRKYEVHIPRTNLFVEEAVDGIITTRGSDIKLSEVGGRVVSSKGDKKLKILKIRLIPDFTGYNILHDSKGNKVIVEKNSIVLINFYEKDILFVHKRFAEKYKIDACFLKPGSAIDEALKKYFPGVVTLDYNESRAVWPTPPKNRLSKFNEWYKSQSENKINLIFYLLPSPPLYVDYKKGKTPRGWQKISKISPIEGHAGAVYGIRSNGANCTFNNTKYEIGQQGTYSGSGHLRTTKNTPEPFKYLAPGTPDLQVYYDAGRDAKKGRNSHTVLDLNPWIRARNLDKQAGGHSFKRKYLAMRPPNRSRFDITFSKPSADKNSYANEQSVEQQQLLQEEYFKYQGAITHLHEEMKRMNGVMRNFKDDLYYKNRKSFSKWKSDKHNKYKKTYSANTGMINKFFKSLESKNNDTIDNFVP